MFNVVMVDNGNELLCGMYGTDAKAFSLELATMIRDQLAKNSKYVFVIRPC